MKPGSARKIRVIVSEIFFVLLMALLLIITVKTIPHGIATGDAYPGPMAMDTPTSSPEDLCGNWFSYGKALSESQRKIVEEDYKNCVNARKTPGFENAEKESERYTPIGSSPSSLFTHPAGKGTLIETNFSPLSSQYRIWNVWRASINGLEYDVYAGGREDERGTSATIFTETFWPGVLVIRVSDGHGNFFPEKGGEFLTPQNKGPIRILNEKDNIFTLAARDGSVFYFDFTRLEFLSDSAETPLSRFIGEGVLIESGVPPFYMYQYEWVNQFNLPGQDGSTNYYLAGRLRDNSTQGLFMVLTMSEIDSSFWEGEVFLSPIQDGALRIVAGDAHQLIIVSEDGAIYNFDLAANKFTSATEGVPIASVPIILSPVTESEITPTVTPTPGPTRTALPTNIPYP